MAVTKAKKIEQMQELAGELKGASSAIVATFNKMTVTQDFELRKAVRGAGAKYRVVKNTLAERAAKGTKVESGLKDLTGVTSIAYTSGDPVALAKALSKYVKDNPELAFKAGVVDGQPVSVKDIDALAALPSKEEIYAKVQQAQKRIQEEVGKNISPERMEEIQRRVDEALKRSTQQLNEALKKSTEQLERAKSSLAQAKKSSVDQPRDEKSRDRDLERVSGCRDSPVS